MAIIGDLSADRLIEQFHRELDAMTTYYQRQALHRGIARAQHVWYGLERESRPNPIRTRLWTRRNVVLMALTTAVLLLLLAQLRASSPPTPGFLPHASYSNHRK